MIELKDMEDNATVTLSLPLSTIDKMKEFYAEEIVPSNSLYVYFMAQSDEMTVTAYNKEKDGLRKVVFQGKDAVNESKIWGGPNPATATKKEKIAVMPFSFGEQIGSDEVGTGDFFGPVVVAAAHVDKSFLPELTKLGVTDSKLLSDDQILSIAPTLLEKIDYSLLVLEPEKFNEVTRKGNNMNMIKAKMHNRCLLNLSKRHPGVAVYQDQFAAPKLYFGYLKGESEVLRGITFATKGETKFPSVAAASVIARYAFLTHMMKMSAKYGRDFPLGAAPQTTRFAKEFIATFGLDEMEKVAKTNFANMKKALS